MKCLRKKFQQRNPFEGVDFRSRRGKKVTSEEKNPTISPSDETRNHNEIFICALPVGSLER